MSRIIDTLTFVGGKIISLGSDSRLYWAHATHQDPFTSLKAATLDPSSHQWRPFNVGEAYIEELCAQYRNDAQTRFGFPVLSKALYRDID